MTLSRISDSVKSTHTKQQHFENNAVTRNQITHFEWLPLKVYLEFIFVLSICSSIHNMITC